MFMNMITEMPTTGQFVMVNEYKGAIYGDTYRYTDGNLEILVPTTDGFWSTVEDFDTMHEDITILGYVVLDTTTETSVEA